MVLTATDQAGGRDEKPCKPDPHTRVLIHTARIYAWQTGPNEAAAVGPHSNKTFACARPRGTRHLVVSNDYNLEFAGGDMFQASGRFLAYDDEHAASDSKADERIVVLDVPRNKRIARIPAASEVQALTSYQLSRSGFIVWTQTSDNADGPASSPAKLIAHDSHGTRQLDTGTITHLTLRGERVTWTNGTSTRSARLS